VKFSIFILTGLLISIISCARPDYANNGESAAPTAEKTAVVSNCKVKFSTESLCVSLRWLTSVSTSSAGSLEIKFWPETGNEAGPYVNSLYVLGVALWMPAMGHGSSPVTLTQKGPGEYVVENMYFTMRGDWDIQLLLKDNRKIIEKQVISVHVP